MLKSKRSEYVAAAVLMAPFVVIYGVLFVYPTIKMVELSFTNAPLIGPGTMGGLRQLLAARDRAPVPDRGLEHDLFRAFCRRCRARFSPSSSRSASTGSRAGCKASRSPRSSCPTSCRCRSSFASGTGCSTRISASRNMSSRRSTAASIFRSSALLPLFMPMVALVTIWWLLGFNVLLFVAGPAQHLDRDLRGRRARRRGPLGAVHAHHLAADLAGDRARVHHPAHPAVQDFRSGLSVHPGQATGSTRPW